MSAKHSLGNRSVAEAAVFVESFLSYFILFHHMVNNTVFTVNKGTRNT